VIGERVQCGTRAPACTLSGRSVLRPHAAVAGQPFLYDLSLGIARPNHVEHGEDKVPAEEADDEAELEDVLDERAQKTMSGEDGYGGHSGAERKMSGAARRDSILIERG
jgi:hypothetical protein